MFNTILVVGLVVVCQVGLDRYKNVPSINEDAIKNSCYNFHYDSLNELPSLVDDDTVIAGKKLISDEDVKVLISRQQQKVSQKKTTDLDRYISSTKDIKLISMFNNMRNDPNFENFVLSIKKAFGSHATYDKVCNMLGWDKK
jgi:hypothetical protein